MNIWQLILVGWTFIRLGTSLYKDIKVVDDKGEKWASVTASLLVFAISIFILYKAGVLVIN